MSISVGSQEVSVASGKKAFLKKTSREEVEVEERGATSTGRKLKGAKTTVVEVDEEAQIVSDSEDPKASSKPNVHAPTEVEKADTEVSDNPEENHDENSAGLLRDMILRCVRGLEEQEADPTHSYSPEDTAPPIKISVKLHQEGFAYISDDRGKHYFKSKNIYDKLQKLLSTIGASEQISESEIETFVFRLKNWRVQESSEVLGEGGQAIPFYDIVFSSIKLIRKDDDYHLIQFEKDICQDDPEVRHWMLRRLDRWMSMPPQTRPDVQIAKKSPMSGKYVTTTEEEDALVNSKEILTATEQSDAQNPKPNSEGKLAGNLLAKKVIAGIRRVKQSSKQSAPGQDAVTGEVQGNTTGGEIDLVTPNRSQLVSNTVNIYTGIGTEEDIGEIDISVKKRASPETDMQVLRESVKATRGSLSRAENTLDSGLPSNKAFRSQTSQYEESNSQIVDEQSRVAQSEVDQSSEVPKSLMTAEELELEKQKYKKKPVEEMAKEILEEFQQRVANEDAFSTESLELYKHLLADHQSLLPESMSSLFKENKGKSSKKRSDSLAPTAMKTAGPARNSFAGRSQPIANTTQALAEISSIREELVNDRDSADPSSLVSQIRRWELERDSAFEQLNTHLSQPHSGLSADQAQYMLSGLSRTVPESLSQLSNDLVALRRLQEHQTRRLCSHLSTAVPAQLQEVVQQRARQSEKEAAVREGQMHVLLQELNDRLSSLTRDSTTLRARVDSLGAEVGDAGSGRDGILREVRELGRAVRRVEEKGLRDDRIEGILAQMVRVQGAANGLVASGIITPGKDRPTSYRSGKSTERREPSAEKRSKSGSKSKVSSGGLSRGRVDEELENEDPVKIKYAMRLIGRRKRHLTNMEKVRDLPTEDSESFVEAYRGRSKSRRSRSSTSRDEGRRRSRSKSKPKFGMSGAQKAYRRRSVREEEDTVDESTDGAVITIGKRRYR